MVKSVLQKKIALRIKDHIAENGSITTTHQLAELIRATIGKREKKNPATRCFQALRIYVNDELKDLGILLESILDVIKKVVELRLFLFIH